jgi:hypothetical protein
MKADDLRNEIIAQTREWEQAQAGSRPEFEAAEAATRAFAELDALMCEGKEPPPAAWAPGAAGGASGYALVKTADLANVLPRVEQQVTLTPWERSSVRRLREAVDDQEGTS